MLLACLAGKIPKQVMLAFRAPLDFIQLAQYTAHDTNTLGESPGYIPAQQGHLGQAQHTQPSQYTQVPHAQTLHPVHL